MQMKFHHVGYLVKNISDSIAAFKAMGFNVTKEPMHDSIRKSIIAFLDSGDNAVCVELIQPENEDSPIFMLLKKYKNTPYHLCFQTENMNEDVKELELNGYMLFKERECAPCIDDGKGDVVFMMNPYIGIIELYKAGNF